MSDMRIGEFELNKKYSIIYADPPWEYTFSGTRDEFKKDDYEWLDDYLKVEAPYNSWVRYRDIMMFTKHCSLPIIVTLSCMVFILGSGLEHDLVAKIVSIVVGLLLYAYSVRVYKNFSDKRLNEMVSVYMVTHCRICNKMEQCRNKNIKVNNIIMRKEIRSTHPDYLKEHA